jgi:hypothetical protein
MKEVQFKTKKEVSDIFGPKTRQEKRCFSSLEGVWKGKSDFSLEEIKEAEIGFKGKVYLTF